MSDAYTYELGEVCEKCARYEKKAWERFNAVALVQLKPGGSMHLYRRHFGRYNRARNETLCGVTI